MEPWSVTTLLICFGGGIMGAALGALFSFIASGIIIFVGCAVVLAGGSNFILMQVGLGPVFGPQIEFCAALVAVTYAVGVKKNFTPGTAKDILSPLVDTSWDVMLVGGIAGVFSHVLMNILVRIPVVNMFDCLALSIVLTIMIARILFMKEMPWGNSESIKKYGWLKTDNYSLSWVPWMAVPSRFAIFSFGVGILCGALAMITKGILDPMVAQGTIPASDAFVVPLIIGLSLAAISLIGLNFATGEIQKFPVWHAQAILSALAYLHFESIVIAGIVGVLAAFLQELMARMFWNHGSSHIDPPACTIASGTFILNIINKMVG